MMQLAAAEPSLEEAEPAGGRTRVLLIKCNCDANDPKYPTVTHPLGIMSIAAYLRKNYGCDARIIDLRVTRFDPDELEAVIREYSPDVVGISALTYESDAIGTVAGCAKKVNPDAPVLLGGPHATAYPAKAIEDTNIDYVVVGEGEVVTGQLIERLMDDRDVSDLKGLAYIRDGEQVLTGRAEVIHDLDSLGMPAYDLIEMEAYSKWQRFSRSGHGVYMCLFSSRGCPYQCIYCHNIFGKGFRARSAESLFEEVRYLHDTYGIRHFDIIEDIFNLDRERLIRFCDLVIDSRLDLTFAFPNGMRCDILDEEQLRKLKQAGTIMISFAVETGSPRLQKVIKKNINLEKIRENIRIARSLRILANGFFMIGFPGETLEEMKMTMDFLVSSKLHSFLLFAVNPYEGTELGDMAREMGLAPIDDFSFQYHGREFVNMTEVPEKKINRLRAMALLRFYLNPVRMFYIARDAPDKREFPKLLYAFVMRLFFKFR
jgi:radical SAM superfamily enzyme YgiQ (UPF0313 family)